jgi:hypothetical protein
MRFANQLAGRTMTSPWGQGIPAGPPAGAGVTPAGPDDATSATRVVFQSLRGFNWEIYIARPDGSDVRRATNFSEADVSPALSRAQGKISSACAWR